MKLLSFGALWCSSCLVMKPRLKEIEKELSEIEIIYYDYDENYEEVERWNVKEVLPTFILVDNDNNELKRVMGEKTKEFIKKMIEEYNK